MSIVEWAGGQTNGLGSQASSSTGAEYFVVALIAIVLALVVWVFIRTSMRQSSKQ